MKRTLMIACLALLSLALVMPVFAGGGGQAAPKGQAGTDVVKVGIFQAMSGSNGANGKQQNGGIEFAHSQQSTVVIGGKTYTYIRIISKNDVNGSILPNAKNTFEKNAAPANEELLLLIIEAAKGR